MGEGRQRKRNNYWNDRHGYQEKTSQMIKKDEEVNQMTITDEDNVGKY